jgi:hypothetical protein
MAVDLIAGRHVDRPARDAQTLTMTRCAARGAAMARSAPTNLQDIEAFSPTPRCAQRRRPAQRRPEKRCQKSFSKDLVLAHQRRVDATANH